ncbi:hypothetical protein ACIBHY_00165 [Nonomuraea sp. NPDC050547]|uniref:hypothetical protein n=1 Tax=Nonomuraea sp. NPDC050547 TaxID=3364368 RepID=UPI0037B02399
MLTVMLIGSLACLAVPVAIYLRMLITGPADRARIHARMAAHRRGPDSGARTRTPPSVPTSTQGAAPSRQTEAAPCHPAADNAQEVSSS